MRTGRHCVHELAARLAFVPKYRRNVFTDEMPTRFRQIIKEVWEKFACVLAEFNGEDDRVHLLRVRLRRSVMGAGFRTWGEWW
ncbi:transposase [Nonomuraea angiospora]|uniref:transposase n=1 Tax=Nonomuraea angiospora TaxID=46172 RepID=UPI00342AACD9